MFLPIRILGSAAVTMIAVAGCAETVAARPGPTEVAQVCTGITQAQARAVFTELSGDVDGVDLARETTKTKPFIERSVGADIHVRATPGMTAQWLARLVHCHVVSEAAAGTCAGSACVFGLPVLSTDVSPTATVFTIALRSSDSDAAREMARRSKALIQQPTVAAAPPR